MDERARWSLSMERMVNGALVELFSSGQPASLTVVSFASHDVVRNWLLIPEDLGNLGGEKFSV